MNKLDVEKQREDCRKLADAQWYLLIGDINKKTGLNINNFKDLRLEYPDDKKKSLIIQVLLEYTEKKIFSSIKEVLYRYIACLDWLKGELLIDVIDTLFRHFENDKMLFENCKIDDDSFETIISLDKCYIGVKTWDELFTIDTRWVIGLALESLLNYRLVSHKKYQVKLQTLIKNKKYRKGRSELVTAYAKLAKQEAIPDLINLLEDWDLDILGRTIEALGNLKAKEAKSYLEKLLKHEDPYFRNLAKKALKKIG